MTPPIREKRPSVAGHTGVGAVQAAIPGRSETLPLDGSSGAQVPLPSAKPLVAQKPANASSSSSAAAASRRKSTVGPSPPIDNIDLTQYDDSYDADCEKMRTEIIALCVNKSPDGMSLEILKQLETYFKRIRTKVVWNTMLAGYTQHSSRHRQVSVGFIIMCKNLYKTKYIRQSPNRTNRASTISRIK